MKGKFFSDINPIQRKGIPNPRYYVGYGHVILPYNINRIDYINDVYKRGEVVVVTEEGEVIQNLKVDKWNIQFLEFPEDNKSIGSTVVFVNIPYHNQAVLVAVINKADEITILREGEFKLFKNTINGAVLISGRGDKGDLYINVESFKDTGGNLNINVINKSKTAKLNLEVKGDINILSDNITSETTTKTSIRSFNPVNDDASEVIIEREKITLISKDKIELSNDSENLKDSLIDFLDALINSVIQTPSGPGNFAPDTITKLNNVKTAINNLLE